MRRVPTFAVLILAIALGLAACSSDDGASTTTTTGAAAAPTTAPTTEAPDETTTTVTTSVAPTTEVPAETTTSAPEPAPETTEPEPLPVSCGTLDTPDTDQPLFTLTVDGREREYALYIPDTYDSSVPTPLVFNLHGRGSNRGEQAVYGGYTPLADRDGWVLVHPQGITPEGQGAQQWNFGQVLDPSYSDEDFILAVIDDVATRICVDHSRIYSSGMSSGGFMSSTLACRKGHVFAAVAPVAATYFADGLCAEGPAVPIIAFHGTADAVVDYEGFGIAAAAASWAERNGCEPDPIETEIGDVTEFAWDCPEGAETILYVAEGGGHSWPGSPLDIPSLGPVNRDISATDLAWEFFGRHSRAAG